jgi:sugar lactone lactonase YvrE
VSSPRRSGPGLTTRELCPIAHCEGIAVGPDGALWVCDERGTLFRIDPTTRAFDEVANIGGFGCGLCVDGDGLVYVCVWDRGQIVRVNPATGDTHIYSDAVDDGPLPSPNWALFDRDGVLYVSNSCEPGVDELSVASGRIVAIPPGGGPGSTLPLPPLAYPNGMALASDGTLYVIESFIEPRIVAVRGDSLTVHAALPALVPDGLAITEDGGMIVSCFQPNALLWIPPGGGPPTTILEDWTGQRLLTPTNVAFYGEGLRSLAIASVCGWSISTADVPWRGQKLFYPSLR